MARSAAEYIFQRLEVKYQNARQAKEAGEISQDDLDRAAHLATEAAQILAQQKRWILPSLHK